jgi:hypothetical protein
VSVVSGPDKTETLIPADGVIFSAGRFPELVFSKANGEEETEEIADEKAGFMGKWKATMPYKAPRFFHNISIFDTGEPLTDFQAAIKAIAAGRRGAVSIHQVLYDLKPELEPDVVSDESQVQNIHQVQNVAPSQRQIMPLASYEELEDHRELEKGFTPEMAAQEAKRCLQCGLICYAKDNLENADA